MAIVAFVQLILLVRRIKGMLQIIQDYAITFYKFAQIITDYLCLFYAETVQHNQVGRKSKIFRHV